MNDFERPSNTLCLHFGWWATKSFIITNGSGAFLSSGVCDCGKRRAKSLAKSQSSLAKVIPRPTPPHIAINLRTGQKLRICETANGNGNHLSNFNGHANRAILLVRRTPDPDPRAKTPDPAENPIPSRGMVLAKVLPVDF